MAFRAPKRCTFAARARVPAQASRYGFTQCRSLWYLQYGIKPKVPAQYNFHCFARTVDPLYTCRSYVFT